MTKPREKTREELTAEIEDGKKKIRQFENREKIIKQKLSVERWHFHSHTTGSLTPTFVTARPVSLAVRLASAFALFCLISVQAERTFERLRYFLGGDRPSQTAHLTMSPDSIQSRRLEFQYRKDGIPTATP